MLLHELRPDQQCLGQRWQRLRADDEEDCSFDIERKVLIARTSSDEAPAAMRLAMGKRLLFGSSTDDLFVQNPFILPRRQDESIKACVFIANSVWS
ncbi:MAG: hypothetical protein R3C12_03390 [Planctomycetaceae bacterium]